MLDKIDPSALFLLGLVLVVTVVLRRTAKQIKRKPKDSIARLKTERTPIESAGLRDAPANLGRWEVEMHELARDLSAQLDSKIGILQHLIQHADAAVARLEAATQRSQAAASQNGSTPTAEPLWQPPEPSDVGWELREPAAIARTTPGQSIHGSTQRLAVETAAADARYQEIYDLSDAGYTSPDIARRVCSPIGEIDLILSLRAKA